jgi:hypothetical protein
MEESNQAVELFPLFSRSPPDFSSRHHVSSNLLGLLACSKQAELKAGP